MAKSIVNPTAPMRFLRLRDGSTIHAWTPVLAKMPDMIECVSADDGRPLTGDTVERVEDVADQRIGPLNDGQRTALAKLTKHSVRLVLEGLDQTVNDVHSFQELKKQLSTYLRKDNRVAALNSRQPLNVADVLTAAQACGPKGTPGPAGSEPDADLDDAT